MTNAVRYAATPITIVVSLVDGIAEVAVTDREPVAGRVHFDAPAPDLDPDALAEGGRGLAIVAALADDCGVVQLPDGKRVWFRRWLAHNPISSGGAFPG